ncbi:hypothetical protein [Burkholderia phage vB_BglM_WTB]
MIDISGFGLTGHVIASQTFPAGFEVSAFADDLDPLDSAELEVAEATFGLNGDMVTWSRPNGIEITLGVIPNSPDDLNLEVLLEANRAAKGKTLAFDIVNIVVTYPNGQLVTLNQGKILRGRPVNQVVSAGRIASKPYMFRFENVSKSNPTPAA